MIPVRTKAPTTPVVSLADLKAHLRVDHSAEDTLITSYEAAAVAHLDGYRGMLGRCIAEQEWTVTFGEAGKHRLPLPDVISVTASAGSATLSHDHLGSIVELSEPASVVMTCKLPPDALDAVKMAIKLLVGHWYANREAVVTGTIATTLPLAFDALIRPIQRVSL